MDSIDTADVSRREELTIQVVGTENKKRVWQQVSTF